MAEFLVAKEDLEHIRLHVWELQQMIDRMRLEGNPEASRLEHILERFVKAAPSEDRP